MRPYQILPEAPFLGEYLENTEYRADPDHDANCGQLALGQGPASGIEHEDGPARKRNEQVDAERKSQLVERLGLGFDAAADRRP